MQRLRLGIIANEFFEPKLGRMGGFGWVARAVARTFEDNQHLGVDPVFLTEEPQAEFVTTVGGTPLLAPKTGKFEFLRRLRTHKFDALLTIDFRPTYSRLLTVFGKTPLIFWVHDPRTPFDNSRTASLRVPGYPDTPAQGVGSIETRGFSYIERQSGLVRRPLAYAAHARYLRDKVEGTYDVSPRTFHFLPDPITLGDPARETPDRPVVIFLGRLDPIKRPWLAVEVAQQMPDVDFVFLGQAQFSGPGGWEIPDRAPSNVKFMGHVGPAEKSQWLGRASLLINTSIHEALPISFLEALAAGVPIVAGQDPDEVVSRFGRYVPRSEGDGRWTVPYFVEAIKELLSKDTVRNQLGEAGRGWVRDTHTRQGFLLGLQDVLNTLGVRKPFVDTDLHSARIEP